MIVESNRMPTYTVHEPPPRKGDSRERSGALRVRARRILFLGLRAGAAVAAAAPAVAGALRSIVVVSIVLGVGLRLTRRVRDRAIPRRPVGRAADRLRSGDAAALDAGAARLEACSASWSATIAKRRSSASLPNGPSATDAAPPPAAPPPASPRAAPARRADAVRRHRPVPRAGDAAMSVAIVDYGSGNLHSAAKAFERAARESGHDQPIVVTSDPDASRARRPRGAARRRRLRRLPARARRRSRHDRGAGTRACASRAGRSSASASACS